MANDAAQRAVKWRHRRSNIFMVWCAFWIVLSLLGGWLRWIPRSYGVLSLIVSAAVSIAIVVGGYLFADWVASRWRRRAEPRVAPPPMEGGGHG